MVTTGDTYGVWRLNLPGSERYPATYRAPKLKVVTSVLSVIILMLLALFGRAHIDSISSIGVRIFAGICLAFVTLSRMNDSSSRITLYADRIEKKTWFSTKTWRRNDVAGLWFNKSGDFRLFRKCNKEDYFIIPAGIRRDETWDDWLKDVPDTEIKSLNFRFFSKSKAG